MNTLIVYASKYGCTERCAKSLSELIAGKTALHNLKQEKNIDPSPYDTIIIGGSIYIGQIHKEVKEFCAKNLDLLKEKKVGLFICCMRDGEEAEGQMNSAFPKQLLDLAAAIGYFGGEFNFKKMKALDKFIAKKVAKVDKDTSNIFEDNIKEFAASINNV